MNDNLFFSSDIHFSHKNIIKYCDRPFKDVETMNREIIHRWNLKVPKDGVVYILGDISMTISWRKTVELVEQLNGTKHLIFGNHDSHLIDIKEFRNLFHTISPLKEIYVQDEELEDGKILIVLCHYAMRVWNQSHRGSWHLYGHSHGTLPEVKASLDIGLDTNNMYPYSYEDIKFKLWKSSTGQLKTSEQLSLEL